MITEPPFMKIPGQPSYWFRDNQEEVDKHRALVEQMERAKRLDIKSKSGYTAPVDQQTDGERA